MSSTKFSNLGGRLHRTAQPEITLQRFDSTKLPHAVGSSELVLRKVLNISDVMYEIMQKYHFSGDIK